MFRQIAQVVIILQVGSRQYVSGPVPIVIQSNTMLPIAGIQVTRMIG